MTSGVVLDVDLEYASDTLVADVDAADTVLQLQTVIEFADEEDDGGWLVWGDGTTPRAYTAVDETANTITLAEAAGEDLEAGLTIWAWDPTTLEGSKVVEYVAQVELPDELKPVPATLRHDLVAFSDVELLRGASVRLEENEDGEWEIVEVLGRQPVLDVAFLNLKWESGDQVILTATHVTNGTVTLPLSHEPLPESFLAWWHPGGEDYAGIDRTDYDLDAEGQTVTFPLGSRAAAGDLIRVRYPYRGARTIEVEEIELLDIPIGHTWKYATGLSSSTTYAQVAFDDSAWADGETMFGWGGGQATTVPSPMNVWARLEVETSGGDLTFTTPAVDNLAWVYLDGVEIWDPVYPSLGASITVPCDAGTHVIAFRGIGDGNVQDKAGFAITEEAP